MAQSRSAVYATPDRSRLDIHYQAVIAINNVGLFEEVQARNRDLTALREVGRTVSSTLDLKVVLKSIVDRAVELSNTDGGSILYYRPEIGRFELGETAGFEERW